ncbi:MAG: hypothetical protein HRT74_00685 [Flavobacteriales bacterium]|nr:hypothetical protein [Flavobacteriales bacterium]
MVNFRAQYFFMRAILFFAIAMCFACGITTSLQAQVPQGLSYQAVARDADGLPLQNSEVTVRLSIRSSSFDGIIQYQEEHLSFTDEFGLFSLIIGEGVASNAGLVDDFEDIPWDDASHFLQVEWMEDGGTFLNLGTTQFYAVPYALVAGTAVNVDDNDANPNNETIDEVTFVDDVISIVEDGENFDVDLGPRFDEVGAGQTINLVQLVGDSLNIVEGSETFIVDMTSLGDDGQWENTNEAVYNTNQSIGVGTNNPTSTMHVEGSMSVGVIQITGPIVVSLDETHNVILANVTSGNITVNLPSASTCSGRKYTIKTMGPEGQPLTSSCTILAAAGESIDNENGYLMDEFLSQFITIISDGSNWWIIDEQ